MLWQALSTLYVMLVGVVSMAVVSSRDTHSYRFVVGQVDVDLSLAPGQAMPPKTVTFPSMQVTIHDPICSSSMPSTQAAGNLRLRLNVSLMRSTSGEAQSAPPRVGVAYTAAAHT
jgi:hypothetical protein